MARVYERPRYAEQARNKLVSLAVATRDQSIVARTCAALKLSAAEAWSSRAHYDYIAEVALDGEDIDGDLPGLDSKLEEYLLDAEIGRQAASARLTAPESASKIMKDFLTVYDTIAPKEVLTDEHALFWMVGLAYNDKGIYTEAEDSRIARHRAYDLILHQLASQKVAPGMFNSVYSGTPMVASPPPMSATADAWARAAEELLTRSHPMWVKYCRLWASPPRRVRPKLADIIRRVAEAGALERHKATPMREVLPQAQCYNYAGVLVLYIDGTMVVADAALASYFRTCMSAWSNATWAFSMYRVCGDTGTSNYSGEFGRCLKWISSAISDYSRARYVARHMHLAYTRWQNSVGEDLAPIDCGWADRDKSLKTDMIGVYPFSTSWWDLVESLKVPLRAKAEFFKLYHLLPPPDIDPLLLHNTLIARTADANTCRPGAVAAFIAFCKSYDLCRYMVKRHRLPKYACISDYTLPDLPWVKSCIRGKLTLPPQEDWGKAWICKEFSYDHTSDFHVLAAKDSTRVVANLPAYMDRSQSRSLSKVDQNELLSAVFNGPILSNGEDMAAWRARVMRGDLRDDDWVIAAEAGKAENTKPGAKVRETLSACDTVREYLSEVDHSIRPLAALTPGVSIRVDSVKHKKKFQAMAHSLSAASTQHAFGSSTDITGWSPKMSREMFHAWQEYALGTTECENPRGQVALWDRLILFCDRRGVKRSDPCRSGNIQGWPATSDTTMHAHILIYWAYRLRKAGILSKKEAAHMLCLIDDVATVVALEGSIEACVDKARRAREMLAETYAELGFEVDSVKSFFSAVKFVYLNELYLDGAQVMHCTKTLMRIDKDYSRRFASLSDNIATAFGTAAAAANQGADPFVAYFMAAHKTFRWAFKAKPELAEEPGAVLTAIAMAPASMNGLGVRAITSVMATGEADHLTYFIEVVGTLASMVNHPRLTKTFNNILAQEMSERTAVSVFNNPTAISAATHRDANAAIRKSFRDAARAHGMAEPFASLDKLEHEDAYTQALEKVLEAGAFEATVLEEVSASMPAAFVDEVMARVDRTELVSYLLGPKGIASLRQQVSRCDQHNLEVIVGLSKGKSYYLVDYVAEMDKMGSFHVAHAIREANLLASGYQVLNHTYPCPFALWAFQGPVSVETEQARALTTVTFNTSRLRATIGCETSNLYDSVPTRPGYRGYRSMKSSVANEVRAIIYNPVRKKVARGLAAIRWAMSNGSDVRPLSDLFLWAWAGEIDDRLMTLPGKEVEGSAKRLSLRHSKTNHAVAIFHNCQSAVMVNAQAVTRYHAKVHPNGSTMYDMMASITAMRCSGLLEAALGMRLGNASFEYGFAYKDDPSSGETRVPLLTVSHDRCREVPRSVFEAVTPFVAVEGPFGDAAKRVCNYRVMAETLEEYMTSGAEAARRVFEAATLEADMDEDFALANEGSAAAVRVMTTAQRYSAAAEVWEASYHRQRRVQVGAAAPMEAPRSVTMTLPTAEPLLDPRAGARRVAHAWRDTMALNLVERDSRFAAELAKVAIDPSPDWEEGVTDWVDKCHNLKMTKMEFRAVMKNIADFGVIGGGHECASLFFNYFGAIGFHHAPEAEDSDEGLWHRASSYMGTAAYIESAAKSVGMRLRNLKGRSPEDYASVAISAGPNDTSAVTRVLKAQWRMAAERRLMRAEAMAKDGAPMKSTTGLNYEAVFYRCAARVLQPTGRFSEAQWMAQVVTQTLDSLANHIEAQTGRTGFVARVAADELDYPETVRDFQELTLRVRQLAAAASDYTDTTDPAAMVAALRVVNAHVYQDISGAHLAVPYKRSHVTVQSSSVASTARFVAGGAMGEFALIPEEPTNLDISAAVSASVLAPIVLGSAVDDDFAAAEPADAVQWVFLDAGRTAELGLNINDIHRVYREVTATQEGFEAWRAAVQSRVDTSSYSMPGFTILGAPAWEDEAGDAEGDFAA